MRKFSLLVALVSLASLSVAQSFTIRSPLEGARVRENVAIKIPKGSIPEGSYIGVIVNGKFLEAAFPKVEDEDYVYYLDTKGRRIPDGDMDLEVVLYMDFNDRAEIVNRSSVKVKLDNYTSIKIPDEGLRLTYNWKKGKEFVYRRTEQMSIGTITQAQAQLGSKAGELPLAAEVIRMLYAVDDVTKGENGTEALLRMQALPDKGKNYTMLTTSASQTSKKYYDFQMAPIYMKVTSTGREIWGAVGTYFPLEGTSGETSRTDLFAVIPLPVLPSKALYPGDTWQAQHLFASLDLEKLYETESITKPLASRGTFVGVEWERGMPCAKFTIAVDAGPREIANAVNLNSQPGESQKISLNGTVWFSIEQGIVVKSDITMLQESLVTTGSAAQGTTQAPGAAGGSTGKGSGFAGGDIGLDISPGDIQFSPHVDGDGQLWWFQNRSRPGGGTGGAAAGISGGGGQAAGPGLNQRAGGGSTGPTRQIMRVRMRILTELER